MVQPDYLEVRNLTVSFDGFKAVDNVDLTVFQKDLRFLIGPNGAGKTTIIDAMTGLVPATGTVKFGATELIGRKSHQIARLGVGRTFQTASVFTELTVLQNLDIAAGAKRSAWSLLGVRRRVPDNVAEALETVALTREVNKPAGVLSHGQKQWLEIGMLLVQESRVLLLDEPVAGMSQDERDATGDLLKRVGADRTVIVVEHDMDFMRTWADSVTVLHQGKVLSEGSVAAVQADPKVQEVYLGRAASGDEAAVAAVLQDVMAPTASAPVTEGVK
jgi:urea transport system ATP-binding protein